MKKSALTEKLNLMSDRANGITEAVNQLAMELPENSPGRVHAYEAQQHLQDAMNRVSNLVPFLLQRTDEAIEAEVDAAAAGGKLEIVK